MIELSAKRRRAISINERLVIRLNARAATLNEITRLGETECKKPKGRVPKITPTGLALQILLGEARPIGPYIPNKTRKHISMRESYWLSLRVRGEKVGFGAPKVAALILEGKLEPLTKEEISEGERIARERESKRDSSPRKKRSRAKRKKTESTAPNKQKIKIVLDDEEDEFEKEARLKRQAALPQGTPIEKSKAHRNSALKDIENENDCLGGVFSF